MLKLPSVAITIPLAALTCTTGCTTATCTGAPLLWPSVVTTAVRAPVLAGGVVRVTESDEVVAAVTVPAALSLNCTVLLAGVASKLPPVITTVPPVIAMGVL